MALKLTILSHPNLPTGGAISFRLPDGRGADIGREPYMDWVLPDAQRHISGHHCEIRWEDKGFLLYDISRNGTFLNGSPQRLAGPHRLAHGDQISIGPYLIAVTLEGAALPPAPAEPQRNDPWPEAGAWSLPAAAPPVPAPPVLPPIPPAARAPLGAADPFRAEPAPPPFALPAALATPRLPERAPDPVPAAPLARGGSIWDSPLPPGEPAPPAPPLPAAPIPAPPAMPGPSPAGLPPLIARAQEFAAPDFSPPDFSPSAFAPSGFAPPAFSAPEFAAPASAAPAAAAPPVAPPAAPLPPRVAAPQAPPPAAPNAAAAPQAGDAALLERLAAAAGVPVQVFAQRQPGEVMDDVGAQLALTVARLMRLLAARTETKQAIRSGHHTQIRAVDNNPLKFSPTPDDAMRLMLGPPLRSYLDGRRALDQAFRDLENHQMRIFAAMQQALTLLLEDLDPAALERSLPTETGVAGLISNRRARLWQHYATVWSTLANRNDDGLVGVFMDYFARCYDDLETSDQR